MGRWTSKSHEIGPESERTLKVEIYSEEGNVPPSRKEITPRMRGMGTAVERGTSPAPSMDVAETTWVCGLDFDFSVS